MTDIAKKNETSKDANSDNKKPKVKNNAKKMKEHIDHMRERHVMYDENMTRFYNTVLYKYMREEQNDMIDDLICENDSMKDQLMINDRQKHVNTVDSVWFYNGYQNKLIEYLRNHLMKLAIPYVTPTEKSPPKYQDLITHMKETANKTKNIRSLYINDKWSAFLNTVNEKWFRDSLQKYRIMFIGNTLNDLPADSPAEVIQETMQKQHDLFFLFHNSMSVAINASFDVFKIYNSVSSNNAQDNFFKNMTNEQYQIHVMEHITINEDWSHFKETNPVLVSDSKSATSTIKQVSKSIPR